MRPMTVRFRLALLAFSECVGLIWQNCLKIWLRLREVTLTFRLPIEILMTLLRAVMAIEICARGGEQVRVPASRPCNVTRTRPCLFSICVLSVVFMMTLTRRVEYRACRLLIVLWMMLLTLMLSVRESGLLFRRWDRLTTLPIRRANCRVLIRTCLVN